MGFLTTNGMLLTYDQYKNKTRCYNALGLKQFTTLYSKHKDKQIEEQDLHWGEEIEYHLYSVDHDNKQVKMSCDAVSILEKFNQMSEKDQNSVGFKLMPEFGRWMIEAVPSSPYNTYSDPE